MRTTWAATAVATGLITAVVFTLGPAAAHASIHYALSYEGPRDAEAVEPLLKAQLLGIDSGYGYGYGYGYGAPPDDGGHGYGYGYGYGYGEGPSFDDLAPGDYRVVGFADLDHDEYPSPQEPKSDGADEAGNTIIHLTGHEDVLVTAVVREAPSDVSGRVVSSEGDAIAGARVTLTDRFGWARNASTGADGAFLAGAAPTGVDYDLLYSIHVEAEGFVPLDTGLVHAVTRGSYQTGDLVLDAIPPNGTAPHVVSVFPTGDKVPPGKPLRIQFSEPMDRESVLAALVVDPALHAPIRVSWENDSTIEVRGHRAMLHGTTYAVTIAGTARSAEGVEMGAPYSWTFTTAPGMKPITGPPSGVTPPGHAADHFDHAKTPPGRSKANEPTTPRHEEKPGPAKKVPDTEASDPPKGKPADAGEPKKADPPASPKKDDATPGKKADPPAAPKKDEPAAPGKKADPPAEPKKNEPAAPPTKKADPRAEPKKNEPASPPTKKADPPAEPKKSGPAAPQPKKADAPAEPNAKGDAQPSPAAAKKDASSEPAAKKDAKGQDAKKSATPAKAKGRK